MPNIIITDEAHEALKTTFNAEWDETCRQLANGNWSLIISDETYNKIMQTRIPGESFSSFIVRIATYAKIKR